MTYRTLVHTMDRGARVVTERELKEARAATHRALAEARRCPACGRGWALVRVPGSDPPVLVCKWRCAEERRLVPEKRKIGATPRARRLAEARAARDRARVRIDAIEAERRERKAWARARERWRTVRWLLRNRERMESDGA